MGVGADALVSSRPAVATAIELATLEPAFVHEVAELERRTFVHPWSEDLFRRELRLPQSRILVARAPSGTIVGYVCRWSTEDSVEIQNVAVHPDWRRHAIARRLVGAVLEEAERTAVGRVWLEVRRHNHPAIRLYESFGFRESGLRRGYYPDGEDALLMELRLPID